MIDFIEADANIFKGNYLSPTLKQRHKFLLRFHNDFGIICSLSSPTPESLPEDRLSVPRRVRTADEQLPADNCQEFVSRRELALAVGGNLQPKVWEAVLPPAWVPDDAPRATKDRQSRTSIQMSDEGGEFRNAQD